MMETRQWLQKSLRRIYNHTVLGTRNGTGNLSSRRILRMSRFMKWFTPGVILMFTLPAVGQQIEPKAGSWRTWAISSGKDFRVPPPPDAASTKGELDWLRGFVAEKDPRIADQVAFWDAGSPGYRWIDLIW